jgi:hypothetical protein
VDKHKMKKVGFAILEENYKNKIKMTLLENKF